MFVSFSWEGAGEFKNPDSLPEFMYFILFGFGPFVLSIHSGSESQVVVGRNVEPVRPLAVIHLFSIFLGGHFFLFFKGGGSCCCFLLGGRVMFV